MHLINSAIYESCQELTKTKLDFRLLSLYFYVLVLFNLCVKYLVLPAAIVSKRAAFLAEMLRMNLGLVTHIQSVWFLQRPLFVREDIDAALDAFLPVVGPGVAAHPLALTLGAFVFAEAPLLALVWS